MGDEVEFVYNTRSRCRSLNDTDFHTRLAAALLNDKQHGNADQDEEVDSFGINDDDGDMDYVPDEDASDIENELVIQPNEIKGFPIGT